MNSTTTFLTAAFGMVLWFWSGPASAQFLPHDFTQSADSIPHIESGSRFGVKIGTDQLEARRILNRNWNIRYVGETRCPEIELGHDYCQPEAKYKDHFTVTGDILGGNIELYISHNKVISIEWWRNPFDP